MDSEDEYDQEMPKPRLNMSHGFIHHIRRNQIDRDNYDKKIKSHSQPKSRTQSRIDKKPESKLYTPPKRINQNSKKTKSDHPSPRKDKKVIFKLEYTSSDGTTHSLLIKRGQDPATLARDFVDQAGIPEDLLETLEWKIKQEQIMRG